MSWYLRYLIVFIALRLVKVLVLVVVPRVRMKRSLKVASPSMVKSSTRKVFEILNLSVARKVTPISARVLGRLTFDGILYWPRTRTLGGASAPVILVLKFVPVMFSRKVEFAVALL